MQRRATAADRPELSVIVIIASDTLRARCGTGLLDRCLAALNQQAEAPLMEILVPHHPQVEGIKALQRKYAAVKFLCIQGLKTFRAEGRSREHHDELRKEGILAARGRIVAFLEDNEDPDTHWSARMAQAHTADVAAVGGAIVHAENAALNWGVYFCDFGRYQPPFPECDSKAASDVNVSYKRSALEAIRPVWRDGYYEPAVHEALLAAGRRILLTPEAVVYQRRGPLSWTDALLERFIWGRSYGANQRRRHLQRRAIWYALGFPLVPGLLLYRIVRTAIRKQRAVPALVKSLPATALLVLSWSAGEFVGYWSAQTHAYRS